MALTLVRTERAGFCASAAEMDSISTPPKENITIAIETQTAPIPLGSSPPSFTRFAVPAAACPGRPTNTRSSPSTIKTITAITLMEERKNSRAPKDLTLTRFRIRIRMPEAVTVTHSGIAGNQYEKYLPTATSSAPVSGTVVAQYAQRPIYPA